MSEPVMLVPCQCDCHKPDPNVPEHLSAGCPSRDEFLRGLYQARDAALAEAERACEEMENARTGEVLLDAGWASACAALAVRIRALREGTE